MKKLLTILLSVLSLTIMAQVPQGVGYQGVATDANGIELVNQSISIRASVLSGSATGTIEWEETHATSTDTFGLFTLTIGQGTNTTNGTQTSFADISWGTNIHFLKIEMDVTGGSTYSNMGTNQMMSVPYALFAESANINYDSISNFLSGDSTFITNVGGGMGGSGCDYKYPEGLDGERMIINLGNGSYTVPTGKKLYMTSFKQHNLGSTLYLKLNNDIFGINENPVIASSGDVVSVDNYSPNGSNSQATVFGYLTDENYFAGCGGGSSSSATSSLDSTAIANMIANSGGNMVFGDYEVKILNWTYIGPSTFVSDIVQTTEDGILSFQAQATTSFYIDSVAFALPTGWNPGSNPFTMYDNNSSDQFISIPIPKGYYYGIQGSSNSGPFIWTPLESGGGSSTTTSSNSVGDFSYPDGKDNITPVIHDLGSSTYTVPTGKNLYITSFSSNSVQDELKISSNPIFKGKGHWSTGQGTPVGHFELPVIAAASEVLESNQGFINGFLVDDNVTPVTNTLSGSSSSNGLNSYTVPAGKILVVLNFFTYTSPQTNGSYGELIANGNFTYLLYGFYNNFAPITGCSPTCLSTSIKSPLFIDENTVLTTGLYAWCVFNGYLMDK